MSDLLSRREARFALVAAVLAAAIAIRAFAPTGTDVSWLLTVGEKMLGGARLYVDIIETNPPASVLLYVPALLLARLTGAAPELMVTLLTFAGAGASLVLCRRILKPAPTFQNAALAALALFLLLIFPAYAFSQRDHAALVFLLPLLACLAARGEARSIALPLALLAGIAGGLGITIKPHYALAAATALGWTAWRRRGLRGLILTPENITALAVCIAYGVMVALAFPEYLHAVLPMVAAVYAPVHRPPAQLLVNPALLIAIAAVAGIAITRTRASILVPAGIAAIAVMLLQGKGWPYHGYVGMTLLLLALGIATLQAQGARRLIACVILTAAGSIGFLWMDTHRDTSAVTAAVAKLAPPHPKIIAISPDIALGHPLTRQLGGTWVGTEWGDWVSHDAALQLAKGGSGHDAALRAYAAQDRKLLARDITQNRPDVILIEDTDWRADAGLTLALAAYRRAAREGSVDIWLRANAAP